VSYVSRTTNKGYRDQRQSVYFRAARDLRATAAQILDDCTGDPYLLEETARWAKNLAREYAVEAEEFEAKGWQVTAMVSTGVKSGLTKSHGDYSRAVDEFERWLSVREIDARAL
jgi:hypothetical protein